MGDNLWISTIEVAGIYPAMLGMRNPMNSWSRGDTYIEKDASYLTSTTIIGDKDLELAQKLIRAGSEHCKFLRQIQVWADISEPRYWWSEFDTYKFNTKESTSTMHTLFNLKRPIEISDFLYSPEDKDIVEIVVERLNVIRDIWLKADGKTQTYCLTRAKRILPEGFIQLRTVNTNYAELRNMYFQRRTHRLKYEWIDVFCTWIESLPYAKELITYEA